LGIVQVLPVKTLVLMPSDKCPCSLPTSSHRQRKHTAWFRDKHCRSNNILS